MADDEDGPALFRRHVLHLAETLRLKLRVADREDLVDHQDLRL
jgi:hypothetical protein